MLGARAELLVYQREDLLREYLKIRERGVVLVVILRQVIFFTLA